MKKQQIKIIKKEDVGVKKPAKPPVVKPAEKNRDVAKEISNWINERRENNDAENRRHRRKFQTWKSDSVIPA